MAVGLTLVVPAVVLGPASPAAADWVPGVCSTNDGVTVIVDFQGLGGGVVTRCALGAQSDGFAALANAGFVVTSAATSPGFLCRIDAKPGPSTDDCVVPSPVAATWAYWTAKRGGSWAYSQVGARNPGTAPTGGVQGWSFSDGTNPPPRSAPPGPVIATSAPPATQPPGPAPTVAPPGATPPSAPSGGSTGGGSTGGAPGAPSATVAPGSPSRSTGSAVPRGSATLPPGVTTTTAPGADPAPPGDPAGSADTTVPPAATPDASVLGASESNSTTRPTTTYPSASAVAASPRTAEGAHGGDAGSPVGTIVAVALLAVVVAGAVVARRLGRKSETSSIP